MQGLAGEFGGHSGKGSKDHVSSEAAETGQNPE